MTFSKQLIIATLALVLSNPAGGADWPNYRGLKHDGVTTETVAPEKWGAEGPKNLWKVSVGVGFASVSVAHGRVYTMGNQSNQDTVYCLDAKTGKVIWQYSYACPLDPHFYEGGPSATPTVNEGRVYTLSKSGDVFCLEADTGKVIWERHLGTEGGPKPPTWGYAGSPLVVGNAVVLDVGDHGTALSKKDGKTTWKTDGGGAGYSSPVPFKGSGPQAVVLLLQAQVAAMDVANGKVLWSYPWKTDYDINAADLIIDGKEVFVSSGYEHGAALLRINNSAPEVVWENKNMRNQLNPSVLVDGYLYGMDGNSAGGTPELRCVEWKTGALKWGSTEIVGGGLIAAGKKLLVMSDKGELAVVDASPTGCKILARAQVLGGKTWTAPVLADGRIYCRNAKGDLVCLE